jgi:putative Ca2+/H+ antiporter (TMEM165/GDT1 family)
MSAAHSPFIVFSGSILGHFCCSSIAVLGGHYLAEKISEQILHLLGGLLMIFFGMITIYGNVLIQS